MEFNLRGRRLTLLQKLGDSLNDLWLRAGFSESCCAREGFGSNCTPHILQMGKLRPRREGLSSEPSDPQCLVPTFLTWGSLCCWRLRGSKQSNGVGQPGWIEPAGPHKTLWLLDHGRPEVLGERPGDILGEEDLGSNSLFSHQEGFLHPFSLHIWISFLGSGSELRVSPLEPKTTLEGWCL